MDVDLLVAGAGPAGIAAAVSAHRRGLSVVCVDRAGFPRDKTCGDGLAAGALRHLEELGVAVPALSTTQPVDTVVVRGPDGRQVVLPMPGDGHHAVVTTRADLDAALVAHARAIGVVVREREPVTAVDVGRDAVRVTHGTTGGQRTTRARFVVAADGHYSTVRRLTADTTTADTTTADTTVAAPEPAPDLGTWHAFRQYYRGVDDRRLWVLFEPDLLPGYAWVFPLPGGRANVGVGVLRDPRTGGKALAALWRDVLDRPALRAALGPSAEPEDRHRAWPIPAAFSRRNVTQGRILFAGDAAGVVDPMTGEGIAQALASGTMAADAVARGGPVAAVAARYRTAVARDLGHDLRFAAALQQVLKTPAGVATALAIVDSSAWTRRNFARWMFEDYPRALVLTPRRWRRGSFTPAGAFRGGTSAGTTPEPVPGSMPTA